MRRNTISGCLLESVSLGKIPLRESQSNLRKDTLNYDLNYIDYPNINDVELTTGLKLLVLSVENHKGEKKFIILAKHAKLHNAKFVTNFLFFLWTINMSNDTRQTR